MQQEVDLVLRHHLENHEAPPVGVNECECPATSFFGRGIGQSVSVLLQPVMGLLDDTGQALFAAFVPQVTVGEAGGAGDVHLAAQHAETLDEDSPGAGPGRGDGRRDPGSTATGNDYIILAIYFHFPKLPPQYDLPEYLFFSMSRTVQLPA